jgi:hypothetical protein
MQKKSVNFHRRTLSHKRKSLQDFLPGVQIIKSGFSNNIVIFRIENSNESILSITDFFNDIKTKLISCINNKINEFSAIKISVELFCQYYKQIENNDREDEDLLQIKSFASKTFQFLTTDEEEEIFSKISNDIVEKTENYYSTGSGWTLLQILFMDITICKYVPLRGSSYIPLPKEIASKHAVINIKNNDNFCILHSIVSAMFPASHHVDRVSSYPDYSSCLKYEGIDFPFEFTKKNIKRLETLNNISLNIWGLDNNSKILSDHIMRLVIEKCLILIYCILKKEIILILAL